ncbi:hypothetical protein PVAND_013058 [Polypedilum vanderplanki]|uniref:Uncharacterized protein n=1 Tax=Polypedilum vanderplanki TaxID=319348 RepID=A0A9J6CNC0_POLVA|nr:hypothetical protein PVAND_013058 [Polypedilum vanderplanki]
MKTFAIVILSLIAAVSAAPTQISENNVGNIVTVGLNANVDVTSQVDVRVITLLASLLNQQLTIANLGLDVPAAEVESNEIPLVQPINEIPLTSVDSEAPQPPKLPRLSNITPEMIAKAKQYLEKMKQ